MTGGTDQDPARLMADLGGSRSVDLLARKGKMEPVVNGKKLEIGRDYRDVVGLPDSCKMIYQGDDTWECHGPNGERQTVVSASQTDKIRAYVCAPSIHMGS